MRAIITKQNADGTYDEVGMNNRTVVGPYKQVSTIVRYARQYANGAPYRIELFHEWLDREPIQVYFGC